MVEITSPFALGVSWATSIGVAAAALAFERARRRAFRLRVRLLREREEEMRRAARSFMAASRTSPDAVVAAVDQAARRMAPEIDASLFFEAKDGALVCTRAAGARAEHYVRCRVPLQDPASAVALAANARHRVDAHAGATPAIPGDRAFLAMPLVDGSASIAVLYVATSAASRFGTMDALVTLTDLAVPAWHLARERESDRRRATIDGLTGLLSARTFRDMLSRLCAGTKPEASAGLALLFIDTDNFKACNDMLGHAAGDLVLRKLAHAIVQAAGPNALVGRNGGDEFCVLLSAIAKSSAIRRAEQIRRSIETFPFATALGVAALPAPITASIGVATLPLDAPSATLLLERADGAMYNSKRNGRNRVSFYRRGAEMAEYSAVTG